MDGRRTRAGDRGRFPRRRQPGLWIALAAALALLPAATWAEEEMPASPHAAGSEPALSPASETGPARAAEAPLADSPVPAAERAKVRRMANPLAGDPAALSKGRLLFAANCQVCHGGPGEGPPANAGFQPPPRDFRSAAFHAARTDGEIFYAIRHGIDGTAMLPWEGRLSESETWMLVAYIRSRATAAP